MATSETISRESRYAVRAYFAPLLWVGAGIRALGRLVFNRRKKSAFIVLVAPTNPKSPPSAPQQTRTDTRRETPA